MPTYQYACTACDHRFEAVQSFSDAALTVCPECEGRLRKVYSGVGVVFKGSGFYRTDSRAGAGAKSPGDGGASGNAAAGGSSSGSGSSGSGTSGSSASGSPSGSSGSSGSGSSGSGSGSSGSGSSRGASSGKSSATSAA